MGASSSKYDHIAQPPLQPASHPIGANAFYTQHKTELTLQVRTPCRGEFAVSDASTGATMFNVQLGNWSSKRLIKDARNNELLRIRRKGWRSRFTGYEAKTDKQVFQIQDNSRWKRFKLRITLRRTDSDQDDDNMTLQLRATSWDRRAEITLEGTGEPVARFARSPADNQRRWLSTKQDYIITIASGVDASLILALFLCLDEKVRNQNNAAASSGASAGASAAASVAV